MAINKEEINQEAFKLVMDTKAHFNQLRKDNRLSQEWKAAENSYFNGTDDFYNGLSKVRIPALHQAVERIVPKMDKVVFPPDGEFFEAKAKDERDDISVEDAINVTALNKQQFKDVGVRNKLIGVYRSLCIYGTVFIATFWDRREERRFERDENGKRREKFVTTFDNPDFYSPRIWDMYLDPKDENLDGSVIERVVKNWHELWSLRKRTEDGEKVGIFDNVEKLKDLKLQTDQDSDRRDSDEIRGLGNHKYGPHERKIEVFRYWGDVPKWFLTASEEDRENHTVVTNALIEIGAVGGNGVVLRIIDNPFDHGQKPYLKGRYIRVDGRAYGLGVMSVNIPLEAELNTLRNQAMDSRTFHLKKKWIKDRNANIDENQLLDLQQLVIDTDLINGLREIDTRDLTAATTSAELNIKQDLEDSTGASKLLSGTPSGSSLDRTAAGVATVVQGGLERFELVVTQFEEDILKPLVQRFWMLNQQFLPEGRDVALTGRGIIRVVPEEIPFEGFDLNFLGIREVGEKAFKASQLNLAFQNIQLFADRGLDPLPVFFEFLRIIGLGKLIPKIDNRPETQLEDTPEGEVQLLLAGKNVKVNLNDDHDAYLAAYTQLLQQPNLPDNVKANTIEAAGQRELIKQWLATGLKDTPQV